MWQCRWTGRTYAKLVQPNTERQILLELTYTCNLKWSNSQKQTIEWWLPGAGRWGNGEMLVKGYKGPVTHGMSKFWRSSVQQSDYSGNTTSCTWNKNCPCKKKSYPCEVMNIPTSSIVVMILRCIHMWNITLYTFNMYHFYLWNIPQRWKTLTSCNARAN